MPTGMDDAAVRDEVEEQRGGQSLEPVYPMLGAKRYQVNYPGKAW